MLKHKSFVINAKKKPKIKGEAMLEKRAPILTPKIAFPKNNDKTSKHYDNNEPISLSLPPSLSSLHEDLGYDDAENEESDVMAHAHSKDSDYDYSEANAYFEEESSYAVQQSGSTEKDTNEIKDKNTAEASKREAEETHDAVVMNPNELKDDESLIEQDKKFEEDIRAILTSKKHFDKDRIQNNPAEALKDKNHGVKDKKNQDQLENKLKNEHAIFDKIAQSMDMASSYDLGSITMDKKFDVLEKETDKDFTKKIHELIEEDKQDENQKKEIIEGIDIAKKEVIDGAETEEVDALKKKVDAAEEDKVDTTDFLKDLDTINTIEQDQKKKDLDTLSKQSSFNSTISIKHRNLKSRVFAVTGSTVELMVNSHWEPLNCSQLNELNVTLTKSIDYWPDSEHGTKKFRIGGSDTKVWNELEPDNYYLTFYFVNNTNPHCELKGTINVIA